VLFEIGDQLGHGPFGHAGSVCELADGGARLVEVLEHHAVGLTDAAAAVCGEPSRHHRVDHREGVPQQCGRVRLRRVAAHRLI
jgi:hypothetical protein